MEKPKEYYAFISYKREDEKWAEWLQNKLEHYKFPTNLNGRTDLPKNIRPTFRDVTDMTPVSVGCSPDGRKIVAGYANGNVIILRFPPLQELIDQTRERFKNRQLTPEERRKYYLE